MNAPETQQFVEWERVIVSTPRADTRATAPPDLATTAEPDYAAVIVWKQEFSWRI